MIHGYFERERRYRRRILALLPVSAVLVGLLFVAFERFRVDDVERIVGLRGALEVLPEITIVPENDVTNAPRRERDVSAMTALDLDLAEGRGILTRFSPVRAPKAESKPRLDLPEFSDQPIRTRPLHSHTATSDDLVIVRMVQPRYPRRELEAGIEGSVLVEILVDTDGRVADAVPLSRVGPESFESASLDAVRQLIFEPPMQAGRPKPIWVRFLVKFRIYG